MLVLCFAACGSKETETTEALFQIKGDTVYVRNAEMLASKIKLCDIAIQPYSREVITAGTVRPIPTQFAYIAPPFSGRIIKSHIKLGERVAPNTPLFDISSPDFTVAQKEYFQAHSAKELASKELKRKKDLLHNGVGSQKELEEATSLSQIAEKEFENARATLLVYQVDPRQMTLGQSLTVFSPIAGQVIENNIVTGQYVKDDAEPVATIADLSRIWITAQVKEKDIRFISEGDDIEMQVSAFPDKTLKGTVFHIENVLDEATRSIQVLSVCDNQDGLLKIGMYTTVRFLNKSADFIHIPEKALLQSEKESYVFVELAPGTFVRTPVEVEATRNGMAVISKGLCTDSRIVSEGGYSFK